VVKCKANQSDAHEGLYVADRTVTVLIYVCGRSEIDSFLDSVPAIMWVDLPSIYRSQGRACWQDGIVRESNLKQFCRDLSVYGKEPHRPFRGPLPAQIGVSPNVEFIPA
jgi:hypothetical protein